MTRRDAWLLAVFCFLPALLFLGASLGDRVLFVGDVMYSFQPWLTFAAQEIQRGRLPLWNPYAACGEPLMANPQLMVFFPPAQFFWLFSYPAAGRFFLFLTETALFVGVYLLLRAWLADRRTPRAARLAALLGALSLAWSGFSVMNWEFASAGATLPLMVLVWLFVWKRRPLLLCPAVALLFLAGYTQLAYYTFFAAALLAFWGLADRRTRAGTAAAVGAAGLGFLMAAPQILSSFDAARRSLRLKISLEEARVAALAPIQWVRLLWPELTDKTVLPFQNSVFDANLWISRFGWKSTFFIGAGAALWMAAGVFRRKERSDAPWILSLVLFGALAAGWAPLLTGLRALVPGLRLMTHFSNAFFPALVIGALFSSRVLADEEKNRGVFRVLLLASCLLSLTLWASPGFRTALMGKVAGTVALTGGQHLFVARAAAATLSVSLLWLLSTGLPRRPRRWLFAALALGELWNFGHDIHPRAPAGFFHVFPGLAGAARGEFRYAPTPYTLLHKTIGGNDLVSGYQTARQALYPNVNVPYRAACAWSYEVFGDMDFIDFRRRLNVENPQGPMLNFLGVKSIVSLLPLPPPARLLARNSFAYLYENPGALPRARWVDKTVVRENSAERLAYLGGPWDPSREVVLEESVPPSAPSTEIKPELRWQEEPGRVAVEGTSGAGWLVRSDAFSRDWKGYLNGEEAAVLRANHAFQAIAVPAGSWRARFIYRPRLFRIGLWLALAAVILYMLGATRALLFQLKAI